MMKDYVIFVFGDQVDFETARSKEEACDLYVEKYKENYINDFGIEPSDDILEDIYENVDVLEAVDLSDDTDLYD